MQSSLCFVLLAEQSTTEGDEGGIQLPVIFFCWARNSKESLPCPREQPNKLGYVPSHGPLCVVRRTCPLCTSVAVRVAGRGNRGGGGGGGAGWARTEVALSLHGPGSGSSTTPLSDALERVVRLQVCTVCSACTRCNRDSDRRPFAADQRRHLA